MDVVEANQIIQSTRDEFLVRFYGWAKDDARREFDKKFPFLRHIRNLSTLRLIPFVNDMSQLDRPVLCSALVKRFHQRAVEILDEFPSVQENALLDRYANCGGVHAWELSDQIDLVDKAKFRKLLLRKLTSVLGEPVGVTGNRETWTHEVVLENWIVRTSIDTGGRRNLGYSQAILARESVPLLDNISILNWLGINSQTDWMYLATAETEEAAGNLVALCSHLLTALPNLLRGLSHNLPEPEVRSWREPVTVKGHRKNGFTIVILDSPELRKVLGSKANWEIPTSIIPESLRKTGSHFCLLQDPAFTRESSDRLALSPTFRHVRVEPC
jgi:hypothetical protein